MAEVTMSATTLFMGLSVISCVVILMYTLYRDTLDETRKALQEAIGQSRDSSVGSISVKDSAPSYFDSGDPLERAVFMSRVQQLEDMQRMFHPLSPPLRRGDYGYQGLREAVVPINIPTRGPLDSFQQSGYLYNKDIPDQAMALMGRRIHSNQYEYYTFHHNNEQIKIPLERQNKSEIYDGDEVTVPGYEKAFKVKIYKNDSPQYIPL